MQICAARIPGIANIFNVSFRLHIDARADLGSPYAPGTESSRFLTRRHFHRLFRNFALTGTCERYTVALQWITPPFRNSPVARGTTRQGSIAHSGGEVRMRKRTLLVMRGRQITKGDRESKLPPTRSQRRNRAATSRCGAIWREGSCLLILCAGLLWAATRDVWAQTGNGPAPPPSEIR